MSLKSLHSTTCFAYLHSNLIDRSSDEWSVFSPNAFSFGDQLLLNWNHTNFVRPPTILGTFTVEELPCDVVALLIFLLVCRPLNMFLLACFVFIFIYIFILLFYNRLPFEYYSGLLQCLDIRNGYIKRFKYQLIVIVKEWEIKKP